MPAWRSTVSSGNRALAPTARRLALLILLALPLPAWAQDIRVAVLPIEGPHGAEATREAVRAAGKVFAVVTQEEWDSSAARLFATSHTAGDIAAVATDVNVGVVVTGRIKRDGHTWDLVISVRQGQSGKATVKLRYPLKGPHLDSLTLRRLGDELVPAIHEAAVTAVPEDAPESSAPAAGGGLSSAAPPPEGEDREPAPAVEARRAEGRAGSRRPPEWASWFEVSAGLALSVRSFSFSQAGAPSYGTGASPALLLDGTLYPLAFLASRGGAAAALSQLGVGFLYGTTALGPSVPCYRMFDDGSCYPTADSYAATEYRWEAGLRWRWNIRQRFDRPELRVNLGYGQHVFAIQRRFYLNEGPRDIGPPDVGYSYLTFGVGLLLPVLTRSRPLLSRLALYADFNWHVPLDAGAIHGVLEWGSGGQIGLRPDLGLELRIFRGLFARLYGQLEYFGLSFDQPPASIRLTPPCPCGTTGSASDFYYGGGLSVGYAY